MYTALSHTSQKPPEEHSKPRTCARSCSQSPRVYLFPINARVGVTYTAPGKQVRVEIKRIHIYIRRNVLAFKRPLTHLVARTFFFFFFFYTARVERRLNSRPSMFGGKMENSLFCGGCGCGNELISVGNRFDYSRLVVVAFVRGTSSSFVRMID